MDGSPAPASRTPASAGAPPLDAEPTGAARVRIILVLGSLIAIAPLTLDMYLPALPAITGDLHTDESQVQLTLTGTLLGLGIGQLLTEHADQFVHHRFTQLRCGCHTHPLHSLIARRARCELRSGGGQHIDHPRFRH